MTQGKVTLKLSTVIQALHPPEDVRTVAGYQEYLTQLFGHEEPRRGPGRPPKKQGPETRTQVLVNDPGRYTREDLETVARRVKEHIEKYPDHFESGTHLVEIGNPQLGSVLLSNGECLLFDGPDFEKAAIL